MLSIKGRIFMSYSSLPKFITIRFRLHRVIPVYNNSSKDKLKGGFCIIPWIKMLNYTSISTKLS